MELATKYSPQEVESRWYQYWMDNKFFASKPDDREPYTIVIPPPNVTGVLHMGHMLNNTIQDILIRKARLDGKNACWVPGTDHASIATEAKVVGKLAQEGIKKSDLTREEFLKHAWAWTEEHGGIILKQLRRLGASCDWDRTAFTMDELRSESVMKVFVDLYERHDNLVTLQPLVLWVFGVDTHCRITHDGLWTCSSNNSVVALLVLVPNLFFATAKDDGIHIGISNIVFQVVKL